MNASELALAMLSWDMLSWEQKRRELDALEEQIKATVLTLGKTQTVGNVRASYSQGRKTYDYETPGRKAPEEIITEHTVPKTDWRMVCKEAGLDAVVVSQSDPSVSLKLL